MKFLHLADLHIGKRVNGYSMIEDQKYILEQILEITKCEQPDAVFIAGDVYDKTIPSADAVTLLDNFVCALAKLNSEVFIISGNHDSPERLAFGSRLMEHSGIHLSPVYDGEVKPFKLDGFNIYMLPFIKPAHVRRFFEDAQIETYTDAVKTAVKAMKIDNNARNIVITHQFVTGSTRSESEDISVGGTDNVDSSVFEGFDYVALGHLHRPQNCGSPRIRYSGTPLKYSFSETNDKKSVTIGELGADGSLSISTVELKPLHDLVELKGKYEELISKSFYEGTDYPTSYIHITLTDEDDIPDVVGKLQTVYKNLMKLDYDNTRTRTSEVIDVGADAEKSSPLELFERFYELQNGSELDEVRADYISALIEKIWEDSDETD